jgi:6-phosphofructokinase 1
MEAVIESLGECRYLSPLRHRVIGKNDFRTDEHRVIYDDSMEGVRDMFERGLSPLNFEMAGPREKIYFDPAKTSAAIVLG